MANRYAVANGNWNSTSTWSATSGGASGASVPVNGDIVYLNANYTVSLSANAACSGLTHTNGTLTLNSYTLEITSDEVMAGDEGFFSTGSTARTINMGSGKIYMSDMNSYTYGSFVLSGSNLTFNAGTSIIVLAVNTSIFGSGTFNTGSRTFNDVVVMFKSAPSNPSSKTLTINGSPTFRSLEIYSENQLTNTVKFDDNAIVTIDKFVAIGPSTSNRLVLSGSGGATGYASLIIKMSCYGQMVNADSMVFATMGLSVPMYLGSNSTQTSSAGYLLQDPPKISTYVDVLETNPLYSSNWVTAPYSGYTLPSATLTSLVGAGYSFAEGKGMISDENYDFVDNDVIFEFPGQASYGELQIFIGDFALSAAPYWHSMGLSGARNAIGVWKSTGLSFIGSRMVYTPYDYTSYAATANGSVTSASSGTQYIKMSISSSDGCLRTTFHDGTSWGSTTTSYLNYGSKEIMSFRASKILVLESANSTSSNPTVLGSINLLDNYTLGYADGHTSVVDESSVWNADANAYDKNPSTYAYTSGVSPP